MGLLSVLQAEHVLAAGELDNVEAQSPGAGLLDGLNLAAHPALGRGLQLNSEILRLGRSLKLDLPVFVELWKGIRTHKKEQLQHRKIDPSVQQLGTY